MTILNAFTDEEQTKLANLDPLAEANNISDPDATDLTDAGNTSLHYHLSDRDRANHSGTQTAATISDFDTEVSNNSAVTANTDKVTNATHSGEVTGATLLTVQPALISAKDTVTPAAGQELLVNDAGTLKKVDAADFLSGGDGVKVYYQESLAISSTTSSTYQNKVTLTLPAGFDAGDYFIEVNYGYRMASTSYDFESRVQLDYSNLDTDIHQEEPQDSDNRLTSFRRFKRTLTAGTHTIGLDYRARTGGGTSYIWDASITVTKLDIQV